MKFYSIEVVSYLSYLSAMPALSWAGLFLALPEVSM